MAIIFIGVLVAFGVMFPAIVDSNYRVSDAQSTQSERILEQQNTDIRITNTTYDATSGELTIDVVNDGTIALTVNETDVIVDGTYQSVPATTVYQGPAKQDGDTDTDVWLAGELLEITIDSGEEPGRVKIVTETGIADASEDIVT